MIRQSMIGAALVLGLMGSTTEAQSDGRAYKVAFWYELARPISTIQYRAYDVAKGEYDKAAVDRWLQTIRDKHPNSGAYVRDLRTGGEPGATEAERLASAIGRERQRWADLNRRPSRPVPNLVGPSPYFSPRARDSGRAGFDRPSPGSPGGPASPPTSPFPYPYRSRPL
jgi:hypothetical protein